MRRFFLGALLCVGAAACSSSGDPTVASSRKAAWTPLAVESDPLVRMPGTQPGGSGNLETPKNCTSCHAGYNTQVEPGHNWKGSMMAQAARDPLFWACLAVAGQDSVWALGTPNAVDLCERCHFPKGWIEDRSDPPNATKMTGADYDGVQCDVCHKMYDPHFEESYAGTREGSDWAGYWDEATAASQTAATATRNADANDATKITLFSDNPFFVANKPFSATYTEAASGQFFVAAGGEKRGPFQDAGAKHGMLYSRFNKSRYFCSSCHDVSNPALANLAHKGLQPGDKTTVLPSESKPASAYFHVERTFSEFMLSAYGKQGGADGVGPFAPTVFTTSAPGNKIARCQDCHMRDVSGVGCNKNSGVSRPSGSTEHPKSGQPLHDMTGGNIWVSYLLASTDAASSNHDATTATLLKQGPAKLTLDLTQGEGVDWKAMLDGVTRAKQQLKLAATITNLSYTSSTGALTFRIQNQTGHKLLSGFPEGRRMFVNIKVTKGPSLLKEINPYDAGAGTLKGMPASLTLAANEEHRDELIYEMKPSSLTVTKEAKTFHFVLATGRHKDNRIPPKGFDIAQAPSRLSEPVWNGAAAPGHFSSAEYTGGYDQVSLTVPAAADQVVVSLYYQVTSREYVEFLRDEINGTVGKTTLPAAAYIIQTDPFFAQLKAWGDTIWQLWDHNKNVPGAAPFLMAQASTGGGTPPCAPPVPTLASVTPAAGQVTLAWSDEHTSDSSVVGYTVYYDQAGKSQQVAQVGKTTTHVDSGLTDGQTYCYKVTARYAACESSPSAVKCAKPGKDTGTSCTSAAECKTGYCVDGMCCSSACGNGSAGDCMACSLAAGAAQNGTCGPVSSGIVCRPASGVCDAAELCNGITTACPVNAPKLDGTACSVSGAAGTCQSGVCVLLGVDAGLPPDQAVQTPDQAVQTPDQAVQTPDQGVTDQGVTDQAVTTLDQGGTDQAMTDQATVDQATTDLADTDQAANDLAVDAGGLDSGAGPDRGIDLGGDVKKPLIRRDEGGCRCSTGNKSGMPWSPILLLLILMAVRQRERS
jgi:hypothetical protein